MNGTPCYLLVCTTAPALVMCFILDISHNGGQKQVMNCYDNCVYFIHVPEVTKTYKYIETLRQWLDIN
jgi:hypothetical protein